MSGNLVQLADRLCATTGPTQALYALGQIARKTGSEKILRLASAKDWVNLRAELAKLEAGLSLGDFCSDDQVQLFPSREQGLGWCPDLEKLSAQMRLFSILPDGLIGFSPLSGGFPTIVHGGLIGGVGYSLSLLEGNFFLPPFKVSVELTGAISPGMVYRGESSVGDSSLFKSRVLPVLGDKELAAVELAVLDAGPTPVAEAEMDVIRIIDATADHPFVQCVDSCVAFGKSNPMGLGLKMFFHKSDSSRSPDFFWTQLEPHGSMGLGAQLMTADELAWWVVYAMTREAGVTVNYENKFYSFPDFTRPLTVFVTRPKKLRAWTKVEVVSYQRTAEETPSIKVISRGHVNYLCDNTIAEGALGGMSLEEFHQERRHIFGL